MSFRGVDHRRPTFLELFVTKLLVTQVTTRYQMKDMNIIFPLNTPKFTVGQVVQILQPLKVQHFFKILKQRWKLTIFAEL